MDRRPGILRDPGRACRTGRRFTSGWLNWFNPKPALEGDSGPLLELAPYPGDEDLPFGHDLGEQLVLSMPRSDAATATWYFDEIPHTVVSVQHLRRAPQIGHFTAELPGGDQVFSLFDRLPEHTVMALTLVLKPPGHHPQSHRAHPPRLGGRFGGGDADPRGCRAGGTGDGPQQQAVPGQPGLLRACRR